jgi:hypothetical protein
MIMEMRNFEISDFDPFSDEALGDPFSFHQNLRDRGPLRWSQKYGHGSGPGAGAAAQRRPLGRAGR